MYKREAKREYLNIKKKEVVQMKIYTSYVANVEKIKGDYEVICIALWLPRYTKAKMLHYPKLAPSKNLLLRYKNGLCNEADYEKEYLNYLETLNPSEIINDLKEMTTKEKIALICYEKPNAFCHRHLVAKWLNEKCGMAIQEI